MKLRMNICDVDFCFEIYSYKKSNEDKYNWCKTNFSIVGKYIDYRIDGWELFLNDEVIYLKSAFKDLLNGDVREACIVRFAEPDFEFIMSPIRTLYSEPGRVWYENGSITLDISVDFKVHFWCDDGAMGSNVFIMTLDREEIDIFYTYLQLVTEEIDKTSEKVALYINKGFIDI